jgi:L,D-transpeptidase ErfK/SrfK
VALLGVAFPATARNFILPPSDVDLVGSVTTTYASQEDTLVDIARQFSIGQEEILHANPNVDRWLPGEGTEVVIPSAYILPRAPRDGLVLNLPEMRVYFYTKDDSGTPMLITYPASIGRMDWKTPLSGGKITKKVKDPAWYPPATIREEHAREGDPLPEVVPAGPNNPLGGYALYLSIPGYLIHGTNKPLGVGMRVTHGCVRLYPEDIERLFPLVSVGASVHIVNQPVKLGWFADTLYMEVQPPLEEENMDEASLLQFALDLVAAEMEIRPANVDMRAVRDAVAEQSGLPVAITQ